MIIKHISAKLDWAELCNEHFPLYKRDFIVKMSSQHFRKFLCQLCCPQGTNTLVSDIKITFGHVYRPVKIGIYQTLKVNSSLI